MNPDPPRQSPKQTTPTGNRRPLLVVRLVIALGLLVGVTIFGISAAQDLMASMDRLATPPLAADPAAPRWQTPHAAGFGNPQSPVGESVVGPNYQELDRDPGTLPTLPGSTRDLAVLQKPSNGLIEESASYLAPIEDALEAIDHYRRAGEQAGFALRMPPGPMTRRAGGMNLQMQRGRQTLSVNVWPIDPAQIAAARPPLRPTTPHRITVILQYPVANPPATGDAPTGP